MKVDLRVRGVVLLATTILTIIITHPLWNGGIWLAELCACAIGRIPVTGLLRIVKGLLPVMVIIAICAGFTANPVSGLPHSWSWGVLTFSLAGLVVGVNYVARILVIVTLSWLVLWRIDADDMLDLAAHCRLPASWTIVMTTALATIPALAQRRQAIVNAQLSRGIKVTDRGIIAQIKQGAQMMIPLIAACIRMSDDVSISLITAGFGSRRALTPMRDLTLTGIDYTVLACITALTVLVGFGVKSGLAVF